MALVFQYGSNMSVARLNNTSRLSGDAEVICIARTIETFELGFTVWSETNNAAAADIMPVEKGRSIYGVIYNIPDFLLSRESALPHNRKSLDAIEGEGKNYIRKTIDLLTADESTITAITYVVKERKIGLKTSFAYVQHIVDGLKEHDIPNDYCQYVVSRIIDNNPDLEKRMPRA